MKNLYSYLDVQIVTIIRMRVFKIYHTKNVPFFKNMKNIAYGSQTVPLLQMQVFNRRVLHAPSRISYVNSISAKLLNLNFHPLEVVSRYHDPQLQVGKK